MVKDYEDFRNQAHGDSKEANARITSASALQRSAEAIRGSETVVTAQVADGMVTTGQVAQNETPALKPETFGIDANATTYMIDGKTTMLGDHGGVTIDKNGNGHGIELKNGKIECFSIENNKRVPFSMANDPQPTIANLYDWSIGKNPESPVAKRCLEEGHPKTVAERRANVNGQVTYMPPAVGTRPYAKEEGEVEYLQAQFQKKITEKPKDKEKDDDDFARLESRMPKSSISLDW